ncbi:hypothetical protein K435DRAFT_512266 [Dendrothele bispora CBS 962.96]|uniref:F-box domain-containing protein n=1 Tax=Dendrothele bispora (strain CBS 962.96) TaxID=1314807 RepID=A0A4S8KVV8_DENBC|nr:hypothetical protein K435DRAFT_512266 [Dendrothele bispora CBS 962.96]
MSQPLFLFVTPVEIICVILEYLPVRDLLRCTVSKRLNKIIADSSSLQFSIELAKYRMRPPSASTSEMPYTARLHLLRSREQGWRTLIPKARHILQLAHSGAVYEFSGGVYGNGKENDQRSTTSITLYDLPILESGTQNHRTFSLDGLDTVDFTMDPSQDLLVLVTLAPRCSDYIYNLHLRSMGTNDIHPLAAASILNCMRRPEHIGWIDGAVRVQISGPLVGFLIKEVINSVGGHLEVYNWRNGGPPCVIQHASGIDDFIFLSQQRLLLVRPNGMFEVYSFSDPGISYNIPILEACYAFPALSDQYSYWYICLSSNPSPGYNPAAGNHGHNKIYYPSPEERLHACCIYVFQPVQTTVHTVFSFVFFFQTATFLDPPKEWMKDPMTMNTGPTTPAVYSPNTEDTTPSDLGADSSSLASSPLASPTPPPLSADPDETFGLSSLPMAQLPTEPSPQQSTLFHSPALPIVRPVSPLQNPHVRGLVYHVPWELWGPKYTRWFRECLSKDWQHSVYGLRTVECITDKDAVDGTHNGPDGGIGEVDDGQSDTDEDGDTNMDSPNSNIDPQTPSVNPGKSSPEMQIPGAEFSGTMSARSMNSPDSVSTPASAASAASSSSSVSSRLRRPVLKHLRLRDFNPYNVDWALDHWKREVGDRGGGDKPSAWHDYWESYDSQGSHGKSPVRDGDGYSTKRLRRIVTEPSTVDVRGVFNTDIESYLPYVEVVTEKEYDTTEVMMDDCRLLLLKVRDHLPVCSVVLRYFVERSKREIEIHEFTQHVMLDNLDNNDIGNH